MGGRRRSRRTARRHVVLLAPRGVDAAPLRSGLERAYREIRRDLPSRDLPPQRARDRRRATARRPSGSTGRIARGVVAIANVSVECGPAAGVRGRAGARAADDRRRLDRWRTLREAERQSTLVHEMTHTALDPDTSGAHAAVADRGRRDVRVQRRPRPPRRAPRAAGLGAEHGAARALQAELDLPAATRASRAPPTRPLGGGRDDRRAARHQGPVPALRRVQRLARSTGGPGRRRPIACCAARSGMSLAELDAAVAGG